MESKRRNKTKIVVIVGPTASGKSNLAVRLAKKFKGEIVSADSRQVYKGMDIGTGKITKKEMMGVSHHLLDIASPKRKFTAAQYQELAGKAIKKINRKNKIPFVCGGTGFYIKMLTEGMTVPEVSPDWSLRKELENKSEKELYATLKEMDPRRARNIEKDNKRRLIRAIEVIKKTGRSVPVIKKSFEYNPLFIGIKISQEELNQKIEKRLLERIKQGMIGEVKDLRNSGLSWKRLEEFGLEYKWVAKYLQNKISYEKMMESLFTDIKKFSKKQMSWWKNDEKINWIKSYKEAEKITENFLY